MIDQKTADEGIKKVLEEISPKTLRRKFSVALNRYGNNIRNLAVKKTPVDTGNLRTSNYLEKSTVDNLTITVGNSANYAAYVEFGTGIFAGELLPNYPQDWQDLAKEYYIDGNGHGKAQPFLYPAVIESEKILKEELDNLFK